MSDDLLSPKDIRKRAEEVEKARLREALEEMKKKQAREEELHEAFLTRDLHPEWRQRLNRAISAAVEQGKDEILVFRFPAEWCNDKGRAINNFEPDWPETVTGFAKRAAELYEKELKPLGYKHRAQILSFPGGMPGEVGVYLSW